MYRDSVDAFSHLLRGLDEEGKSLEDPNIFTITSTMETLKNGIRHCCVQVLFRSGIEYKLDAFGNEADELHLRARTHPTFSLLTV